MQDCVRWLAGLFTASLAAPGMAQCSAALSSARATPETVVAGDELFVAGAAGPYWQEETVERYDPSTGAWSVLGLSPPRSLFSMTAVRGRVLFAGGYDLGAGQFTDRVDLYDAVTGAWSTGALSVVRSDVTAAAVGSKALFAGGWISNGLLLASARVDVYDAVTDSWSTASLSQGRAGMTVAVAGDLLIFAGGQKAWSPIGGYVQSEVVDIFDAVTGQWSTGKLSQARTGIVATSVGSTALFAGGWSSTSPTWVASDVVDVFDGASNQWSSATLSSPRVWHAATALAGKACFAGGWTPDPDNPPNSYPTDAVDVYDALTATWSVAHLSTPRYSVGAATFAARAYFAGGSIGNHAGESVVDVLDTSTGVWSVQTLGEARGGLAAAALSDRLVFVGGDGACPSDPGPDPCPSAFVDIFPAGGARPFCFGEAAACGCSNPGAGPAGCANSTGAGATLTSAGCSSMSSEDLSLRAGAMPVGTLALLFVGDQAPGGGAGVPFGDGLRCVGGEVTRLGTHAVDADGAAVWGPGLADDAGLVIGDLRRFQAFYRDPASPCGTGFNASNGVEVELTR